MIGASKSPVGKAEVTAKTPEKTELPTTVHEASERTAEFDFEVHEEMKLEEVDELVDEHEMEMKSSVAVATGRK